MPLGTGGGGGAAFAAATLASPEMREKSFLAARSVGSQPSPLSMRTWVNAT